MYKQPEQPLKYNKDKTWKPEICHHPEHNFPTMLYIPPGETREHI